MKEASGSVNMGRVEIVDAPLPTGVTPEGEVPALGTANSGALPDAEKFIAYIQNELDLVEASREKYLASVTKWRRQRLARPELEIKNEPFPKSANVSPPITAQRVNTVFAKVLANFSVKRPFWSGETDEQEYAEHAPVLSKEINGMSASPFHINLGEKNKTLLYNTVSLGTQFYEVQWEFERTPLVDPVSGKITGLKPRKNGLAVEAIELEDFYTRVQWTDLQKAPWIAKRFYKTFQELKELESQMRYENVDKVIGNENVDVEEHEEALANLEKVSIDKTSSVEPTNMYEIIKVWGYWQGADKTLVDWIVVFERKTGTILRAEVNPLGMRLVGKLDYFRIPGMLYAVGLCQQLELLQDEGDMLHNLRLDNLRWTMLNLFIGKKDTGLKPDEPVWPGKMLLTENGKDDLMALTFPDLSQSSYQAEMLVGAYADRVSAVNDAVAGFADQTLKSGGGAMAQQGMAAASSSILSAEFEMLEDSYAEMGRMFLVLMSYHKDLVDMSFVSEEERPLLEAVLNLPPESLPLRFKFRIETTDAAKTEQAKRENLLVFSQMYAQYGQEIGSYVQLIAQGGQMDAVLPAPTVVPFGLKMITGKTKIMEKMIDFLDIGKPEDYLMDVEPLVAAIGAQGAGTGQGGAGQGAPQGAGMGGGGGVGMGGAPVGAPAAGATADSGGF